MNTLSSSFRFSVFFWKQTNKKLLKHYVMFQGNVQLSACWSLKHCFFLHLPQTPTVQCNIRWNSLNDWARWLQVGHLWSLFLHLLRVNRHDKTNNKEDNISLFWYFYESKNVIFSNIHNMPFKEAMDWGYWAKLKDELYAALFSCWSFPLHCRLGIFLIGPTSYSLVTGH